MLETATGFTPGGVGKSDAPAASVRRIQVRESVLRVYTPRMCYSVFVSTSSPEDLAVLSSALVKFERASAEGSAASILLHPYRWFIGSKTGCSCTFRHATNAELGFDKPQDWYPEEDDEKAATASFIAAVRKLLAGGYEVDCVDLWAEEVPAEIARRDVDLSVVQDEEFRFFENFHFVFTSGVQGRAKA